MSAKQVHAAPSTGVELRHLSWIITVPLLVIAVVFAVANRSKVAIDLWPLPVTLEPPFYLVVLVAVFVGFLAGGVVVWLSGGRRRRRARELRFRNEELERELAHLRRRLERAEEAAAEAGERLPPARTGT